MVRKLVRRLLARYSISEPAQFKSINKIKRSSVEKSLKKRDQKMFQEKTVNQKLAYKNFEIIMASNIIREQLIHRL